MATLEFKKDANGEITKEAVGMYSKENEYVPFNEPFMCTGQVRHESVFLNPENQNWIDKRNRIRGNVGNKSKLYRMEYVN